MPRLFNVISKKKKKEENKRGKKTHTKKQKNGSSGKTIKNSFKVRPLVRETTFSLDLSFLMGCD